MENMKANFKVGDWLILKETYVQKILIMANGKVHFFNEYMHPHKLKTIYENKDKVSPITLEFSDGRRWGLTQNAFRLATEKEINEHKIKSIFLKDRVK